jgi:hypothetical protein
MTEEWLVSKKRGRRKPRLREANFLCSLRYFLTPALFRQVNRVLPSRFRADRRGKSRWSFQPLLFVVLCLTWCQGDSQPERFETARAFYIACHAKRRRPGKTFQGFRCALAALPARCLRRIAVLFRQHLLVRLAPFLFTDGWAVFGCDGSRLRCPRTEELETHLGDPGGDSSSGHKPPQLWLTALVHLATGVPWSWRLGKGDASERGHLAKLVDTLITGALVVTDAGYQAYALALSLADANAFFLMRVSTQTIFYTTDASLQVENTKSGAKEVTIAEMDKWTDKTVYYWPKEAQEKKEKALEVRLIRIQGKKAAVWLVTNVLLEAKLTVAMASKFYKMRWENEGYFRTYKQTLKKVKLSGRTVKAVHREALAAMLAVQVLLAQGAAGAVALGKKKAANSARQLLLLVRREIQGSLRGRAKRGFLDKAGACDREQRTRTSNKQKREWPSRQAPKPLKPPRIRLLDDATNLLLLQCLDAAA